MPNAKQENLFAESAGEDDAYARDAANRGGKRVFHAPGDTNLFGGSFTPFKDIWNAAAADLGITTKRMRNDALASAAADEQVWRDTSSALSDELARQRTSATNPNDVAQLRVLDTQLGMANRMRQSANPKLQEAGINMLGKITDEQRSYEERQEAQQIARDTHDEAARKALGDTAWSRLNEVSDDLHRESQPFLEQRAAWDRTKAAFVNEPSAAGDLSLIFNYMKVLDPGSVVREGEFATAQNAAGVPAIALTAYNNLLREGQRLTPEQRKDFYTQAKQLYVNAGAQQRERNGRYLERARAGGVPEQYLDSLTLPVEVADTSEPTNFGEPPQPPANPANAGPPQTDSTARMIGDSAAQGVKTFGAQVNDFLEGATGLPTPNMRSSRKFWQTPLQPDRTHVSGVIRRPTND